MHEGFTITSRKPNRQRRLNDHNIDTLDRLLDFVAAIERAVGKKAETILKPMQPGDVLETFADVEDLRRDFAFAPDTPLQTGIDRFVAWYRSYEESVRSR